MKNITCVFLFFYTLFLNAGQPDDPAAALSREFDLSGKISPEIHCYKMESCLKHFAPNGTLSGKDYFRLTIQYTPASLTKGGFDEITCQRFTVQLSGSEEYELTGLKNWKYELKLGAAEGPMFGIEHAVFDKLTDQKGEVLSAAVTYYVYNAFIDFHSFINIFGGSVEGAPGIQDLKKIGQKITHYSANSSPTINLGASVDTGSYFKNGLVTLQFRGLGLIDGRACALVEYDSGESAFRMVMNAGQNTKITTNGTSHYKGDIYRDLISSWVKQATMIEMVTSETILPFAPGRVYTAAEREITILDIPAR